VGKAFSVISVAFLLKLPCPPKHLWWALPIQSCSLDLNLFAQCPPYSLCFFASVIDRAKLDRNTFQNICFNSSSEIEGLFPSSSLAARKSCKSSEEFLIGQKNILFAAFC
jgi:hypothetical protein